MGKRKPAEDFSRAGPSESEGAREGSGHLADRTAHRRASVRAMARAVMAFRLMDRTETQTDIAPSWISAAAIAPRVIEARKGMNMGAPFVWAKENPPRISPGRDRVTRTEMEGSGHLLDRMAHMKARVRAIEPTVLVFWAK